MTGLPHDAGSIGQNAASGISPCSRKMSAGPISLSGRLPQDPLRASKALTATSGPIPEGSPMVIKTGVSVRPSAGLDIGFAAQIAHVAASENAHLLLVELL